MFKEITNANIGDLNIFFTNNKLPIVASFELLNNPFLHIFVYMEDKKIVGYLNYSILYDKAELNYIFVLPEYRNKGIGAKLVEYLLKQCKSCENITLEVRKDNVAAINLYKKYGFQQCAIRKNYYHGSDGLLMIRSRGE